MGLGTGDIVRSIVVEDAVGTEDIEGVFESLACWSLGFNCAGWMELVDSDIGGSGRIGSFPNGLVGPRRVDSPPTA